MIERPDRQVPGLYHRRIGDVVVTALLDGYVDASFDALRGIEANDADAMLRAKFRPSPPRISVNSFLLRTADRMALVDTGSGDTMGPTLGRLQATLDAIGIPAASIDLVLLTHMHPDHSNGLTEASGTPRFPNAEIVVSEDDVRHWHDNGARARVEESQKVRYFDGARFQIKPYRDRLRPAHGEVFPNVTAIPLAGHTPGHTGYLVASGGETLLIWGDICHVPDIQVARPEVAMAFDSDPHAAITTRRRTLDMAATDGVLVAGMHLHFPGFAHVTRHAAGHALEPESWAFTL